MVTITYDEFVLKGARSTVAVSLPKVPGGELETQIPLKSKEIVPRRVYLMPGDYRTTGTHKDAQDASQLRPGLDPGEVTQRHAEIGWKARSPKM